MLTDIIKYSSEFWVLYGYYSFQKNNAELIE